MRVLCSPLISIVATSSSFAAPPFTTVLLRTSDDFVPSITTAVWYALIIESVIWFPFPETFKVSSFPFNIELSNSPDFPASIKLSVEVASPESPFNVAFLIVIYFVISLPSSLYPTTTFIGSSFDLSVSTVIVICPSFLVIYIP